MSILAVDLGGTKLATGLFSDTIDLLSKEKTLLNKRTGDQVGYLIKDQISAGLQQALQKNDPVKAIGISVPGIYFEKEGTVWAPNIPGWENYPLLNMIKEITPDIPVIIQSDRSCYITSEIVKGAAKGCADAVFISVGTGIGAGIVSGGKILRGAHDIAGAIGWMALERPFQPKYVSCGCFESTSSGDGIAKLAMEKIEEQPGYIGILKTISSIGLSAHDVFDAFELQDSIALEVIQHCIETWGMALANIVSLLNPQVVIFGGGVFGPATKWIPQIVDEATKWAQPVSMKQVVVKAASFGSDAGLIGAACLAHQNS